MASPGKAHEALQTITTRVLMLLAAEGRFVRGRPGAPGRVAAAPRGLGPHRLPS